MNKQIQNKVKKLIKELALNCSIDEFKDKVNWNNISHSQKLSEDFIREFKDKIDILLYNEIHLEKTIETKTKECKEYAKKHGLKITKKYLYAFRDHDERGRGVFSKSTYYEKGTYYKDWHCDMRENEENSFGFGIWPQGNTKVRIKIEDWGVAVNKNDDKARVWGFEIVEG